MPNKASLVLSGLIMLLSLWGIVSAWGWPAKAALFPLVLARCRLAGSPSAPAGSRSLPGFRSSSAG